MYASDYHLTVPLFKPEVKVSEVKVSRNPGHTTLYSVLGSDSNQLILTTFKGNFTDIPGDCIHRTRHGCQLKHELPLEVHVHWFESLSLSHRTQENSSKGVKSEYPSIISPYTTNLQLLFLPPRMDVPCAPVWLCWSRWVAICHFHRAGERGRQCTCLRLGTLVPLNH